MHSLMMMPHGAMRSLVRTRNRILLVPWYCQFMPGHDDRVALRFHCCLYLDATILEGNALHAKSKA